MSNQGFLARMIRLITERLGKKRSAANGQDDDTRTPEELGQMYFHRGRTNARSGNLRMAVRDFDNALEKISDFAEVVEWRAEALDMLAESAQAGTEYERARRLRAAVRPGAPDRRYVLRRHGRFASEIAAYDFVSRYINKTVFPIVARGNAHLAEGRPDAALVDYDKALRIQPKIEDVAGLKGEAFSAAGRFEEAIVEFDTALAADPNDEETLNGRGIALMALGRIDEANDSWRRQLALLPAGRAAARAFVALRLADYPTALYELERAVLRKPTDPYWLLYLNVSLRRTGAALAAVPYQTDAWSSLLLGLQAGSVDEAEVNRKADTSDRRAEAAFQIAMMLWEKDPSAAEGYLRTVVECGRPALVEYAAARNELARLGSPSI